MNNNEGKPWAWCAGFARFCVKQAARDIGVDASWYPDTFRVQTLVETLAAAGRQVQQPVAGCVFAYVNDNGSGHCGIVLGVADGKLRTIEGNTNESGSREGVAVLAKERTITAKLKFFHLG
jgi:hypothetical protein